jgi:GNAT superfamily N-acetyltransferase
MMGESINLYWIIVDPAAQRKGLGQYLLEYVERDIIINSGRIVLIETSSQKIYIVPPFVFTRRMVTNWRRVSRIFTESVVISWRSRKN